MTREEIIDKLIEISKQQAAIVGSLATVEAMIDSGYLAYWVKKPYLGSRDVLNEINLAVAVIRDVQ